MSRHQKSRKEVATSFSCRDTNCIEKKVATTPSYRDINSENLRSRHQSDVATLVVKKRGRDKIKLSRHQFLQRHVATKQRHLRQNRDNRGRDKDSMSRQYQPAGPVNLKSTIRCIEIRAQLQNPINTQLLMKKRSSWRLEREIWVAEGSCILIFLFFSFVFILD